MDHCEGYNGVASNISKEKLHVDNLETERCVKTGVAQKAIDLWPEWLMIGLSFKKSLFSQLDITTDVLYIYFVVWRPTTYVTKED